MSSLGSLLKRKDMAKRKIPRSEIERGRRGGLYPEAVAGARMRTGQRNVDNWVCFPVRSTRGVASHPVITSITALASDEEADIAPPEIG